MSQCGDASSDLNWFKRKFYREMTGVMLYLSFVVFCLMPIQVFPPILISGGKISASYSDLFKTMSPKCFGSRIWSFIWLHLTMRVCISLYNST